MPLRGDSKVSDAELALAQQHLHDFGWLLLRGFQMDRAMFSDLIGHMCRKITFDPARASTDDHTQKVDAGLGPPGLHIENGNTPIRPDLVAFLSERSALSGSQTTLCDGAALRADMSVVQKARYGCPVTVERILPQESWQRYLVNETSDLKKVSDITSAHIPAFQDAIPGQGFDLHEDGRVTYRLKLNPTIGSRFSGQQAFANAILGPSNNYAPPRYVFEDGDEIDRCEIVSPIVQAETFTTELNWQEGDLVILDNMRVMHGRLRTRSGYWDVRLDLMGV